MHWERKNVNPMLALRNAVCNSRWQEMWQKAVLQWAGSSVTWQLTPVHNGTKLVFTHDGFTQVNEGYERTRGAWVYFLASLKSYLETGKGTPGIPPGFK